MTLRWLRHYRKRARYLEAHNDKLHKYIMRLNEAGAELDAEAEEMRRLLLRCSVLAFDDKVTPHMPFGLEEELKAFIKK